MHAFGTSDCGQFSWTRIARSSLPTTEVTTSQSEADTILPLSSSRVAHQEYAPRFSRETRSHIPSIATAAGVMSFPIEVLTEVFSYLVWTRPLEADLVVATHVCRHWRIAALADALLWAHISATSVAKARSFLERSGKVPVDIHVSGPSNVDGMTDLLRCYGSRLRTLRVDTAHVPMIARYLAQLSQMEAPLLEVLDLDGPEAAPWGPYTSQYLRIVQSQCSREPFPMPRLRHLRLRPFGIPWDSSIYQNLSTLDIRAPGIRPPSMKRLLNILSQCPELEFFRLQSTIERGPGIQPGDVESMVHLPRLAEFHLHGPSPSQISALLKHVTLPQHTRYVFTTAEMPAIPGHFPVIPANCHHLPRLAAFRKIEFKQLDAHTVLLTCWHAHANSGDPTLSLTVRTTDICAALTNLATAVNLKGVETFIIALSSGTEIAFADWYSALPDLMSVRTLRFVNASNNTLRCALNALRMPLAVSPTQSVSQMRGADGGPARLLCPVLTELALKDVERPCRISTDLVWLCDERRRLGCAMKNVEADEGYLPDRCVANLRKRGVCIGS